jgi:hypothetical protein
LKCQIPVRPDGGVSVSFADAYDVAVATVAALDRPRR